MDVYGYDQRSLDKHGYLHSKNGPAIICPEYVAWYNHGKRHRKDGPAVEWNDGLNGKLHREDGPAVEWENGKKVWWINNEKQTHMNSQNIPPIIDFLYLPQYWYLYGMWYSKKEYFKELEKLRGKEYADMIRLIYA